MRERRLINYLKNMRNKVIISLAVLAGAVGLWAFSGTDNNKAPLTTIRDTDWTRGAASPKVELIEYGDFQCPACKAYEGLLFQLQEEFKDTLVFAYRHFPLAQIHPNGKSVV